MRLALILLLAVVAVQCHEEDKPKAEAPTNVCTATGPLDDILWYAQLKKSMVCFCETSIIRIRTAAPWLFFFQ
jgi:hypothetical protein